MLTPGALALTIPASMPGGLAGPWSVCPCATVPVLELETTVCLCLDSTDWKIGSTWLTIPTAVEPRRFCLLAFKF